MMMMRGRRGKAGSLRSAVRGGRGCQEEVCEVDLVCAGWPSERSVLERRSRSSRSVSSPLLAQTA